MTMYPTWTEVKRSLTDSYGIISDGRECPNVRSSGEPYAWALAFGTAKEFLRRRPARIQQGRQVA